MMNFKEKKIIGPITMYHYKAKEQSMRIPSEGEIRVGSVPGTGTRSKERTVVNPGEYEKNNFAVLKNIRKQKAVLSL